MGAGGGLGLGVGAGVGTGAGFGAQALTSRQNAAIVLTLATFGQIGAMAGLRLVRVSDCAAAGLAIAAIANIGDKRSVAATKERAVMWMPFELTEMATAWAVRETLWVVIWGTLGLMILIGASWRAKEHVDPERDDWDKMV